VSIQPNAEQGAQDSFKVTARCGCNCHNSAGGCLVNRAMLEQIASLEATVAQQADDNQKLIAWIRARQGPCTLTDHQIMSAVKGWDSMQSQAESQPNAEQGAQKKPMGFERRWLDEARTDCNGCRAAYDYIRHLEATVAQQASENQALRQEIEALHTSVFDAGIAQGRAHAAGVIRAAQAYRVKRDEYRAHEALYHDVGLDECDECGRLHNEALGLEAEMVRALDEVEQEVPS
jgi:cell division protein FtsB